MNIINSQIFKRSRKLFYACIALDFRELSNTEICMLLNFRISKFLRGQILQFSDVVLLRLSNSQISIFESSNLSTFLYLQVHRVLFFFFFKATLTEPHLSLDPRLILIAQNIKKSEEG